MADDPPSGYSGTIYLNDGNFAPITNPGIAADGMFEADVEGWRKAFPRQEIKRIDSSKPFEIAEADLLIKKLNYPIALIYFNQYALRYRGTDWEAYCIERTAYCLLQTNDNDKKAFKLLKNFIKRKPEPFNHRDRVDLHRCRALLGRLYEERGDWDKALEQFEQCTHFRTDGEETLNLLRIAELKLLQPDFNVEKLREIHRQYIMLVMFTPPQTPGRMTILRKLIRNNSGPDFAELQNIFKQDYPYCKL